MAAGDEITGVNGRSIKGKTKVEVAKMIQEVKVRAAVGVGTQRPPGHFRDLQPSEAPAGLEGAWPSHWSLPRRIRARATLQPPSVSPAFMA